VTCTELGTWTTVPDPGEMILAVAALTTGVISDSRATVEAIKAFEEVNRIVCREDFKVNL